MSPAMVIFGHQTKELIPVLPYHYSPHPTWEENVVKRKEALRHRHARAMETWSEHSRQLPQLRVGDHVLIQNQTGNFPTKWDRSGVVVEVRQHHQYLIRVDGAGRVILRNRQFLRKFTPHTVAPPPEQPPTPREYTDIPLRSSPLGRHDRDPPASPRATTPPTVATPQDTERAEDTQQPTLPTQERDLQSQEMVDPRTTRENPAPPVPRTSGRQRSNPKWHESYLF